MTIATAEELLEINVVEGPGDEAVQFQLELSWYDPLKSATLRGRYSVSQIATEIKIDRDVCRPVADCRNAIGA